VDSLGVAPKFPACGAGVFLLDDEPDRVSKRKPRDSNSQSATGGHLFSGQAPGHRPKVGRSRMTSVNQPLAVPGVGIEPTATCFRDRYRVPAATTPEQIRESRHEAPPSSSGRRGRTFVSWFKARQPTASRSPTSKCEVQSTKYERAAAAGVEPAIVSLTGSCLTVWPHRKTGVGDKEPLASHLSLAPCPLSLPKRPAGVEPALPPWQGDQLASC
jgi:hypothetical protein